MDRPKVAAIIQARMGSTRFPGKVLMPLAGKPVLWHIIHRLTQCQTVDMVAIATSDHPVDDPIETFAADQGMEIVRGSEANVLQRYALAVEKLDPHYIVRVTGDAPLIDPETVDLLVREMVLQDADFCLGESSEPTIHEGIDPFSRRALYKLLAEAANDPVAREHVTAYFKLNPGFVRIAHVPLPCGCEIEGVRASVDTPADLLFLETLYEKLAASPGEINVRQAVKLLKQQPELKQINNKVRQKKATESSRFIIIRCDGDETIGLGHVSRCLALARQLRDSHSWGVLFAIATGTVGMNKLLEASFPVEKQPEDMAESDWLAALIDERHPDALLFDIRTGLKRNDLEQWRQQGLLIVSLDDASDRRLAADLSFHPPVPQARRLEWPRFEGEALIGWEWILISERYNQPRPIPHNPQPHILVTMGGSDPANLTLLALEALERIEGEFTATLVLGPAFAHDAELSESLCKTKRAYEIVRNLPDLVEQTANADFAIAAFGGTAYELAARGVPSVLLGLTADHAESARCLADAGLAVNLGLADTITPDRLAETISEILPQRDWIAMVAEKSRVFFDIPGARHMANRIVEAMERKPR